MEANDGAKMLHKQEKEMGWYKEGHLIQPAEMGHRWHHPTNTTDVTNFARAFMEANDGLPVYKLYPKVVSHLKTKAGLPVPDWRNTGSNVGGVIDGSPGTLA